MKEDLNFSEVYRTQLHVFTGSLNADILNISTVQICFYSKRREQETQMRIGIEAKTEQHYGGFVNEIKYRSRYRC